ncbi:MAG: uracil-DNA glycosylase [Myxococcota bacterium]
MRDGDPRRAVLREVRTFLEGLRADGIDHLPRPAPVSPVDAPETPHAAATGRPEPTLFPRSTDEGLEEIRTDLGDCRRCRLCEERDQIVFGEGNPRARVVFVGEGPGAEEDRTGRPFVGRAGELLTRMIGALGWKREDVYICNVVKCRPPENRAPQMDEVASCRSFLERQLRAIAPQVIVTLGKPAASTLLGRPIAITKIRGLWQEWEGIPLMPTYHPAYLLRNYTRETRQAVWDDLRAVLAHVEGTPDP